MEKKKASKQSECGPAPDWYRADWKPSYYCVYQKHAAGLLALDDATLGKLYRAQLSYLLDQASTPPQDGIVALAFNFCKASMYEDFEHGLYRSWQAYYASHKRENVEAAKEGAEYRTITEDNGRCRELSNINTITQEQHITQERNNSLTSKQQKTQETSSTQSSCEKAHEAEEDLIDEDNFSSFSFDLKTSQLLSDFVCKRHGYDKPNVSSWHYQSKNNNLESLLDYLHDSIMQSGIDKSVLIEDAKDFHKELRRRQALGLPFAPSDWNEIAMRQLFDCLLIPEGDMRRFYDTDTDHSEAGALSWICQECFNGSATPEELRQELEERRNEAAIEQLKTIPNKDLTRSVLEAYIKLQGYDLCDDDLDRILQADIRSSWTAYVDKCAENSSREDEDSDGYLF